MNLYFSSWPTNPVRPPKYSSVRNPSDKVLVVEEQSLTIDDGNWHPNYAPSPNYLATRHRPGSPDATGKDSEGRGNAAFADGHGDMITQKYSYDRSHWDSTQP